MIEWLMQTFSWLQHEVAMICVYLLWPLFKFMFDGN